MTNAGVPGQCEIGVVGLDVAGRRLALAMAEQRLSVAIFDRNAENVNVLQDEAPGISLHIAASMAQLTGLLRQFRTVVFSGSDAGDDLFSELLEHLEAGDLLIDAGNCHFKDRGRRARCLAERNIRHIEIGIIGGGEDGGCPVLMVGGRPETYLSVLPILELMASHGVGGQCVSRLGARRGRTLCQNDLRRHRIRFDATGSGDIRPAETRARFG